MPDDAPVMTASLLIARSFRDVSRSSSTMTSRAAPHRGPVKRAHSACERNSGFAHSCHKQASRLNGFELSAYATLSTLGGATGAGAGIGGGGGATSTG